MNAVRYDVPDLEHDEMMAKRFGCTVGPKGRLERRVVWNLFQHLSAAGWHVTQVYDGDEFKQVHTVKGAMELIFDLDEVSVRFARGKGKGNEHGVLLIMGNGVDIVSDWTFSEGDGDGFHAVMNAFDSEACA